MLAMRYSVSVTAAKLMMETLYQQLYQRKPIEQAIATSRQELHRRKERRATYNYIIELEDWLLPVVYQNGKPALNIRKFTPEEENERFLQQRIPEEARQALPYGFFGRDLDILKIEKNLLVRSNILLLQGMGGAGKTTLLKYLAGWWRRTGFVQQVFYFGYDVKAYTLNEIIYHIAQKIYSWSEYGGFTALLPALQEDRIVKVLKTNNHALILDNTESITGEKLAIAHTLAEEERKALKRFLSELKGGQSPVIIGSRASEDWLKSGTFDNNSYQLKGLDQESATNFALRILEDINVPVKKVVNDADFERLMKLLAGYPLALKAILPNLKQKTTQRILKELEEGISDLDKGNVQQRTESIIKCIEYAQSNLSEEAQQLLLCLAPFQSIVNLEPNIIKDYFEELKKEEQFKSYPFDKLETVVQEAIQNGFMQEAIPNSSLRLINLQPVFTYFLKNRINTESAILKQSLQIAFIRYYRKLSITFFLFLTSNESQKLQFGLFYIRYEYENLYKVLALSLDREESILDAYRVIFEFLYKNQLHQKCLQVAEMVHERMQQYSPQRLIGEIGFEFGEVKLKLARIYEILKRYNPALEIYKQILNLLDTNPLFFDNPGLIRGNIYQNLGLVSQEQKVYGAAKEYYEKALAIYEQYQEVYLQGQVYQNLGNVSLEQKDFPAAKEYSQKALAIFVQYGYIHSSGEVYQNLGNVSLKQNDLPAAKEYYEKALAIFVQYQDIYRQGRVYQNLGIISQVQKDFPTAKEYNKKALDIFVQYQDIYRQGRVYHNLGIISQEQQEYPAAKAYYEKALAIFLTFPEDINSVANIIWVIYEFVQVTKDKAFGQTMIQNALPYFEGNFKAYLMKLLDDINQL